VLHYRLKAGTLIDNGPSLVSFRLKPVIRRDKEKERKAGCDTCCF
jgi:hypothetical protein